MEVGANRCELTARIVELDALRYTPAGIPALNLTIEHGSSLLEAGQLREVKAVVKAIALGSMAERLAIQPIGSAWKFTGFLANSRNGKQLQLHIQEMTLDH